jgi:Zn-finger nucleic acid-binding protein
MLRGTLRDIPLHECGKCYGLWVGTAAFERICRDAEQSAAALGTAQAVTGPVALAPVRYLRCPECHELMHRVNFARCSGVIVDVCKPHGTWFDANELHRIVHFIRAGGLDHARSKEKNQLEEERRRLATARAGNASGHYERTPAAADPDLLEFVVRAAGCLLGAWLRR